ncbi:hypothetical protein ABVT39_004085 [Epinephelus coioides]
MASSGLAAFASSQQNRKIPAVRFNLLEDLEMDRLQFSRQVLQRVLGLATNQLDYIFAFPGKKVFEVIFTTDRHLEVCLQRFEEKKKTTPSLQKISMTPLADRDQKTVHVMIFSEKVKHQDVWTWMSRYCDVTNGTELTDIDGIKTGTRRFQVRLRRSEGRLHHIPNTIQLGAFCGSAFYPGQPKQCRKCGSLEHLAAACPSNNCRKCQASDHSTDQCPMPLVCNLCSSTSHRFKDCPQAYSNRVKSLFVRTPLVTLRSDSARSDSAVPAPQHPDENPPQDAPPQDMEDSPISHEPVLDWSAEPLPAEDTANVSSTSIPPVSSHETVQLTASTPDSALPTQLQRGPVSLQEAGNMLDSLLANLPALTSDPETPTKRGNLLLEGATALPSSVPLFESPPEDSSDPSKKRPLESSASECNIASRDNYKVFEDRWSFGPSVWSGDNKNRSSGVAILFKGHDFSIQRVQHILDGRLLCIDIEWRQSKFRIINVYCPADRNGRLETVKAIQPLLLCGRDVVLGRDFNCLINIKDRMTSSKVRLDSSSEALKNLIQDFRLKDSFRETNPNTPGYTWSNGSTHSRIDFLFLSKGLQVTNASVKPVFFSDHSKVECTILLRNDGKTSGRPWKLNVSLLQNSNVVAKFRVKLKLWSSLQFTYNSVGDWWEDLKSRAMNFFKTEGKRIAMEKRLYCKRKQAKLQCLYTMAHAGFDVAEEISKLKKEMMSLSAEATKGLLLRSRVHHIENNEKCSRYFFQKVASSKTTIDSLLDENGKDLTNITDILSRVQTFYSDLYKEEQIDPRILHSLLSKVDIVSNREACGYILNKVLFTLQTNRWQQRADHAVSLSDKFLLHLGINNWTSGHQDVTDDHGKITTIAALLFTSSNGSEIDRLQFSRLVVQKELGFSPQQLDYVFALPGKRTFEVIFTTLLLFEQCLECFEQRKVNNLRLANIGLTSLSEREPKAATVLIVTFCRNCQSTEHTTKDCDQPTRCNLCSSSSHTFRSCPQSYANRARHPTSTDDTEFPPAEERPSPEGPDSTDKTQPGPAGQEQPPPLTQVSPAPTYDQATLVSTNTQATSESTIRQDLQATLFPESDEETGEESGGEPGAKDEEEAVHPSQATLELQTGRCLPGEFEPIEEVHPNRWGLLVTEQERTISQVMQQLQEDLPHGQPGLAPEECCLPSATPSDCRDLRDLLDLGLQDQTSPGGAASSSIPSSSNESMPPLKRPKGISGTPSTNVPDVEVWSNAPHPSAPFLDLEALSAFSATTHMGGSRKEKKKRKKQKLACA